MHKHAYFMQEQVPYREDIKSLKMPVQNKLNYLSSLLKYGSTKAFCLALSCLSSCSVNISVK